MTTYALSCVIYFLLCLGMFHILHRLQDRFHFAQFEVNLICIALGGVAYGALRLLAGKIDILAAFILTIGALWAYDEFQWRFLQ